MATTRLMPLHNRKDQTMENSINNIIEEESAPKRVSIFRIHQSWLLNI